MFRLVTSPSIVTGANQACFGGAVNVDWQSRLFPTSGPAERCVLQKRLLSDAMHENIVSLFVYFGRLPGTLALWVVLLFAMVLSFVATSGLTGLRQSTSMPQRKGLLGSHEPRPGWVAKGA